MTLDSIIHEIKNAESIIILTHEHPDGDAIGSSLALYSALKKLGKTADVVIPEYNRVFDFLPNIEVLKKEPLLEKYDLAIWAHHGIFGTGEDFDSTFGLVDTVEKSAEILVKVLSMTHEKRQTITRQNFEDLAVDFKVTLDPETLKICK